MQLPRPGERFEGRYEILNVLGKGAFGRVYRAQDEAMGRTVALKVLSPNGDEYSTMTAARFVREAKLLAELQDPHTLTLYDFGESADGLLFMATEFIEGQELKQVLQREVRLPEEVVVHILRQLLSSLREAHRQNLLHRDIKPANIMVYSYEDDPYRVKLLDFGLVKSVDVDATQLTGQGRIAGTPRYMSPEQVLGTKLTPGSDLYSLGLVAYEMLVGEPAITGDTQQALLIEQVQGDPIEVPEDRASERLRQIVERMTNRNLLQRSSDAQSVLTQLDTLRRDSVQTRVREFSSSTSRGVPLQENTTPPQRESRGHIVFAAGASLFVLVMIVATLLPGTSPAPDPEPRRLDELLKTPAATRGVSVVEASIDEDPEPAPVDLGRKAPPNGCGKPLAPTDRYPDGLEGIHNGPHEFSLVVPTSYDPNKPHPLVVLLHDARSTSVSVTRRSRIVESANRNGYLVVAPRDRAALTWRESSSMDEVHSAIEYIQENACVDPRRIYLWGNGYGAEAAQVVLCDRDDIAAMATTYYRTDGIPSCLDRPVPHISVAGKEDQYAPVEGGKQCLNRNVMSLADQERLWKKHNNCAQESSTSGDCSSWACDTPFVSCLIDGGRRFKNQERRTLDFLRCDGPPTTVEVAEVVWNFFAANPRRD